MLKVRTRRTCLHGAGITKGQRSDKGLGKIILSAIIQQDGCLITSSPRKPVPGPPPAKLSLKRCTHEAAPSATELKKGNEGQETVQDHASSHPVPTSADQVLTGDPDVQPSVSGESHDEDIIFSPHFHPLRCSTDDSNQSAPHADVSTAESQPREERSLQVAAPATPVCPAPCTPEADEDSDENEFDPFLFIKRLPNLSDVVPPFRPHLLPKQTRRCPPVTLVLDLDETLVHSTMDFCNDSDFTFPVHFNNHLHTVHVKRRPYLEKFLEKAAKKFEVVVFTASQSVYADKLLNILDPKRQFVQHRIFRDSCVFVEGNYLKDLSILGRDLSKVAIVDNSPQAFGFQVENGIPIESWFDDRNDTALLDLLPFLEEMSSADDVRPLIDQKFRLRDRINKAKETLSKP